MFKKVYEDVDATFDKDGRVLPTRARLGKIAAATKSTGSSASAGRGRSGGAGDR